MLIITSKQHGFRRCGVAHPAEPTEYQDGTFTQKQIDTLTAEPMLTVVISSGEEPPKKPEKSAKAEKGA